MAKVPKCPVAGPENVWIVYSGLPLDSKGAGLPLPVTWAFMTADRLVFPDLRCRPSDHSPRISPGPFVTVPGV
ncbi:MAG TPA: hypothetical protein VF405_09705 [Gammaproteobacteria bacterium]